MTTGTGRCKRHKYAIYTYLIILHLFVAVVFIKTDTGDRIWRKLGFEIETPELKQHYFRMLAFQSRIDKNLPEGRILFFGDSITQGLAVSAISDKATNYGIGTDTSFGLLSRLPYYESINTASAIVIAIGVNDLKRRPLTEIIGNYKKILKFIPETTPVIASAVMPLDLDDYQLNSGNELVIELNQKIEILCQNLKNCSYINTGKLLLDERGQLAKQYHSGDGIHLNSKAYTIWINQLKSLMQGSDLL